MRKIIWWLSVDNYKFKNQNFETKLTNFFKLLSLKLKKYKVNFKDKTILHLTQSYYAYDFLKEKKVENIKMLSDYLNDEFFNEK